MLQWIDTLNNKPWVSTSERNLLAAHDTMALRLKRVRRIFIKKGKMMKTFDHINRLHDTRNYKGIQRVADMLYRDMPSPWSPRHHKYHELIGYCQFLKEIRAGGEGLLEELRASLNMGHELGDAIYKAAVAICT